VGCTDPESSGDLDRIVPVADGDGGQTEVGDVEEGWL
jgi:hypothetical protein